MSSFYSVFLLGLILATTPQSSLQLEKDSIDFSSLEAQYIPPSSSDIYNSFLKFRRTLEFNKLTEKQKEYLRRLEQSFKHKEVPPKLKITFVPPPSWGQSLQDQIYEDLNKDKISTHIKEFVLKKRYPLLISYCHFVDPRVFEGHPISDSLKKTIELKINDSKIQLIWNRIDRIADGKELAYAIFLSVLTEGFNQDEMKRETCWLPIYVWAFKNIKEIKEKGEAPLFLSSGPPLRFMKQPGYSSLE
ncbi:MAG: hypothetical protein D6797_07295 [Bdellovibrio sp.]|nr:MAG: hypothetical protein D6797_07295 [Bdellovibrio sp.]